MLLPLCLQHAGRLIHEFVSIFSRSEYPNTNRAATVIDRLQLVIDLADGLRNFCLDANHTAPLGGHRDQLRKYCVFRHEKQAVSFVPLKINSTRRFPSMRPLRLRLLLLTVQSL